MSHYNVYNHTCIFCRELDAGGVMLWDLCIWELGNSCRSACSAVGKSRFYLADTAQQWENKPGGGWKIFPSDNLISLDLITYLWGEESLKDDSVAACRSMTLDLLRWRRSFSSSLPGKAASSGVLQAAGDRPLLWMIKDDGHPGWTREMGVEDVLIVLAWEYVDNNVICSENGSYNSRFLLS